VFRSQDYNSLLWVFQQLFGRVLATKPQSSRNVSAEIYVLCQKYKNPSSIDPRFFDPKTVFLNVADDKNSASATQGPRKGLNEVLKGVGKRNRGGYEPGDDFRECSIQEFIDSPTPAEMLVRYNKFSFPPGTTFIENPLTTEEIKSTCSDLKVAGKREFALLLKWRFKIQKEIKQAAKELRKNSSAPLDVVQEDELASVDEEEAVEKEMEMAAKQNSKKISSQEKKQIQKRKKEELKRKATAAGFACDYDVELFQLNDSAATALEEEDEVLDARRVDEFGEPYSSSEEESTKEDSDEEIDRISKLEVDFDVAYELRKKRLADSGVKVLKKQKEKRRQKVLKEWSSEIKTFHGEVEERMAAKLSAIREREEEEDSDDDASESSARLMDDSLENGAGTNISSVEEESGEHGSVTDNIQAERWFSQDIFKHLNRTDDSEGYQEGPNEVVIENELRDEDLPVMPLPERTKRRLKRKAETERRSLKKSRQELKGANPVAEDEGSGKFETVPVEPPKAPMSSQELAEIQALGSLMIHRKSRMDLIDGAYNRYAFNDDPLPEWFADEESKHNTPDLPVTKELVQEFKAKLREIHDRPIKKVVEAQARKKEERATSHVESEEAS